jgi:hypothetical protein
VSTGARTARCPSGIVWPVNRTVLWLLIGVGGVALAVVAVLGAGLAWLATSDGSFDVPYQDAHQVQGTRVDANCQDCLVLQSPAGDTRIELTDSTRYDNHQSFPVGELITAWVPDSPNLDGTWNAIEVNHGTGSRSGRG